LNINLNINNERQGCKIARGDKNNVYGRGLSRGEGE
jgi:hypothetical protein